MTTVTKFQVRNLLIAAVFLIIGTIAVLAAAGILFHIGHASAATSMGDVYAGDPVGLLSQLYDFMRSGKGTLAVGAVMTLVVYGVRHGLLANFAWPKTKLGGYVFGFGTPAIAYLATAFGSGNPMTLSLVLNAIGAGYVAAGGWEHLQDLFSFLGKAKIPPAAGAVATIAILFGALACSGCPNGGTSSGSGVNPIGAFVDCAAQDQSKLESVLAALLPLAMGKSPDWSQIEGLAATNGAMIGGCALAEVVQQYFDSHRALSYELSNPARAALEDFRGKHAAGATFRTSYGDL